MAQVSENGTFEDIRAVTKRDPVVGLTIESYGPAPGMRWVLRPEFRKKVGRE